MKATADAATDSEKWLKKGLKVQAHTKMLSLCQLSREPPQLLFVSVNLRLLTAITIEFNKLREFFAAKSISLLKQNI